MKEKPLLCLFVFYILANCFVTVYYNIIVPIVIVALGFILSFTLARLSPRDSDMRAAYMTFFYSLLIELVIAPLRGINTYIAMSVGFIAFFVYTQLRLKRIGRKVGILNTCLLILLGILVPQTPPRIVHFQDTLITLPDALLHLGAVLLATLVFYFTCRRCIQSSSLN